MKKFKRFILINKRKINLIILFTGGFLAGFLLLYLGKSTKDIATGNLPLNNSPIRSYNQYKKIEIDANCPVKAKKKKTGTSFYHLPGSISYKRLKPSDCFKNEADAKAAGFVKAGN